MSDFIKHLPHPYTSDLPVDETLPTKEAKTMANFPLSPDCQFSFDDVTFDDDSVAWKLFLMMSVVSCLFSTQQERLLQAQVRDALY